ncbi:MAG: SURF1 family cytochrome oxidase biogenesis protein [Corynebacterium sp.]|nr:SURF1 family cytochrome oxidase biogenesis protein [Corynebacterium sp.]
MLKRFLKPGWIFSVVLVIIFVVLAFTVLAPWQLGKNSRTSAENHQIEAALAQDAVSLSSLISGNSASSSDEWRKVTFSGVYVPDSRVVVRMRPVNSTPAYQALALVLTDSGQTLVVDQGYVGTESISTIPALDSAHHDFSGYVRLAEDPSSSGPIDADGFKQISALSTQQMADALGTSGLGNFFIQLLDAPSPLTTLPQPEIKSGPYLSYGIQWIAFGILAPVGVVYLIYSDIREMRRQKEEDEELASLRSNSKEAAGRGAGDDPNATSSTTVTTTASGRRVRPRYGNKTNHYERIRDKDEDRF